MEMVFFDVETTIPCRTGSKFWIVEFGAILVCPKKLVEIESYHTLVRPGDLCAVSQSSSRSQGITRQAVSTAPMFEEVADKIFQILHAHEHIIEKILSDGRVWAGHNIQRFDCARIREAFAEIGRPAPQPAAMVDSLLLLSHKFGKRAGNLKMATLATYFGLGQQKHRSLDDVRMNLEVLKYCATVLLLESSLPNTFSTEMMSSSRIMTRSKSNRRLQVVVEEATGRQSIACPRYRHEDSHARSKLGKVQA